MSTQIGAAILVGPYLQNVTQGSIVIMWESDSAGEAHVEYGRTIQYNHHQKGVTTRTKAGTFIHKVKLAGLNTETTYHYRVTAEGVGSPDASFRTAPRDQTPIRFAVWGDNQSGPEKFERLLNRAVSHAPDILLSVGDVVSRGSDYAGWRQEYFEPIRNVANTIPVFVAEGNHEYLERDNYWFDQFFAAPGHGHYFSFDYGNCHFIFLDNAEAHTRYGHHPYAKGSTQYEWLVSDLRSPQSRDAAFRIVVMHVPAYSRARWGGEEDTRRDLVPLFETFGVDIVFSGHHHLYEQGRWPPGSSPGIRYVVCGGGGGGLFKHQENDPAANPWPQVQKNVIGKHHFCLVEVNGRRLTFKAIDEDGVQIDAFSIGDSAPLPPENIRVAPGDRANQLIWQPNHLRDPDDFDGVVIYRSTSSDSEFKEIASLDKSRDHFTDQHLANGQAYYYRLATRDAVLGIGPYSEGLIAVPRQPGNLANHAFENPAALRDFTVVDKSTDPAAPSIWQITRGRLCQMANIGTANDALRGTFALVDNVECADLVLDVDVQNYGNGWAGLVFRYVDRDNYCQFRWHAKKGDCYLEKIGAKGSADAVVLASVTVSAERPTAVRHLRLLAMGPDITVTISGGDRTAPVSLTARDAGRAEGRAGFYSCLSNPVFFDNLTIATPGYKAPTSGTNVVRPIRDDFEGKKLDPRWTPSRAQVEILSSDLPAGHRDGNTLRLTTGNASTGVIRTGAAANSDYSVAVDVHCRYTPRTPINPLVIDGADDTAVQIPDGAGSFFQSGVIPGTKIDDTFLFFDHDDTSIANRSFGGDEDAIIGAPTPTSRRISRVLMRVDVTVPADEQIVVSEARLRMKLRMVEGPAPVVTLYGISDANTDWDESSTWNRNSGKKPWAGSPGLGTEGTDYDAAFLARKDLAGQMMGEWVTFEFTAAGLAAIAEWRRGKNAGILIRSSREGAGQGHVRFYSNDFANRWDRPMLHIGPRNAAVPQPLPPPPSPVLISQIHTGRYGFVELHNRTAEDVVLKNWSLQCSSHSADDWTWTQGDVLTLNVQIPARGYYLVSANKRYTLERVVPDKIWAEAYNAEFRDVGATVALCSTNERLRSADDPQIVDLVGWGSGNHVQHEGSAPAPAPSPEQSIIRKARQASTTATMSDGGEDTRSSNAYDSCDNAADFVVRGTPFPRNAHQPSAIMGPGLFMREDGSGRFTDGNCYYLIWNPGAGTFHAGKATDGWKTEFAAVPMMQFHETAWRRLRIVGNGHIISYWIDDLMLARVVDYSRNSGFCGLSCGAKSANDPGSGIADFRNFVIGQAE